MKKKCNLVLAGGGVKGSFTMGAIEEIMKLYDIENITGTSVGALIGLYVANDKFDILKSYWENSSFLKNIFNQKYRFGFLESFLFRDSLYRTDMIREIINKDIDFNKWKSNFGLVWTDVQRKEKVEALISKEKTDKKILIDWVISSMALSPAYPIIKTIRRINGHNILAYGCDGGYSDGVPVETLSVLTEEFKTEAEITFIILCSNSGSNESTYDKKPNGIINTFLDTVDNAFNNLFDLNVKYGQIKHWQKYPQHEFKIIKPEKMIMQGVLDFDQTRLKANMFYGQSMARSVLES